MDSVNWLGTKEFRTIVRNVTWLRSSKAFQSGRQILVWQIEKGFLFSSKHFSRSQTRFTSRFVQKSTHCKHCKAIKRCLEKLKFSQIEGPNSYQANEFTLAPEIARDSQWGLKEKCRQRAPVARANVAHPNVFQFLAHSADDHHQWLPILSKGGTAWQRIAKNRIHSRNRKNGKRQRGIRRCLWHKTLAQVALCSNKSKKTKSKGAVTQVSHWIKWLVSSVPESFNSNLCKYLITSKWVR